MELRHEFTVPVPVEQAWGVLLDIERVAPCMPGAVVEGFDGETVEGAVKVKVGPMTVTYRGTAVFEERDEKVHRVVLAANGKDVRGQGTARARVTGELEPGTDASTVVTVHTDLTITGRPAQFGRGVLSEVGDKLIGQFASCLEGKLAAAGSDTDADDASDPADEVDDALDLVKAAGGPVGKRLGAAVLVGAALTVGFAVVRRLRGRRR